MSSTADLLTKYRAAEEAILDGQSYTHNGRQLTMPDLRWVQSEIRRLERLIAVGEGRGGFRTVRFH